MESSGTAKDVPARRNGLSGIKTRLNSDSNHAGPMEEKTDELGTFLQLFIYNKARKSMWHRKKVYSVCYAGEDERCGAAIYKQLTKADNADLTQE